MRKEDYIKKIMTLYQQFEFKTDKQEMVVETFAKKPQANWKELVSFATDNGLDNMEVEDLIHMAALAKEVLGDKTL